MKKTKNHFVAAVVDLVDTLAVAMAVVPVAVQVVVALVAVQVAGKRVVLSFQGEVCSSV